VQFFLIELFQASPEQTTPALTKTTSTSPFFPFFFLQSIQLLKQGDAGGGGDMGSFSK
jgi:hypothetical protein